MAKVFVSYKRMDKAKVFPIVEEIRRSTGVDCWVDLSGIESGDQFQNVIIDAIDNADIVIIMLSKNFIAPYRDEDTGVVDLKKQTFPEKEVMYALNHGKRLIPLSVDGTSIKECKWLDFNCSGLDSIKWKDESQKEKLLKNLILWCGEKEDSADDEDLESKKKSVWFYLKEKRKLFNYIPLFVAIVLLVVGLICKWKDEPYTMVSFGGMFITFIIMIGALFNKRLFGITKLYHVFAFYIPALLFFVVDFCVFVTGEHTPEEQPKAELVEAEPVVSNGNEKTEEITKPREQLEEVKIIDVDGYKLKMILVEGGDVEVRNDYFINREWHYEKMYDATLDDYYIGEIEVTQALWQKVMGYGLKKLWQETRKCDSYSMKDYKFEWEQVGDNYPIYYVNWEDCMSFVKKLNEKTGLNFSLPTEAQWVYAAKGGVKSKGYKYSGSNNVDAVAWRSENSGEDIHVVAQKKPNELGIYDMSGNVAEWCLKNDKEDEANDKPNRGGCYSSYSRECSPDERDTRRKNERMCYFSHFGFRLVLLPEGRGTVKVK